MTTETGRPAAPVSLTYVPQLDGLRGFAVCSWSSITAAYLTAGWGPRPLPGGFIGVDLFFALSGFLITTDPARPARTARPHQLRRVLDATHSPARARVGVRRRRRGGPDRALQRQRRLRRAAQQHHREHALRQQLGTGSRLALPIRTVAHVVARGGGAVLSRVADRAHGDVQAARSPPRCSRGSSRSRQWRSVCTAGACGPTRRTSCRSTFAPTPAPT